MRGAVDTTSDQCAVEIAMEVLGGRWKLAILQKLLTGTHRFGELMRALPGVTQRMLTRQLRELEADGLLVRTVHREVPPRVDYALTETGRSLRPIVDQLDGWGRWYRDSAPRHGTAQEPGHPLGGDAEQQAAGLEVQLDQRGAPTH